METVKAFLVTWVTHNSRISERMIVYNVKKDTGFWMNNESEKIVTQSIADEVSTRKLKILGYNICGDHVHMILVCREREVSSLVRILKSQSSRKHNLQIGATLSLNKGACPLAQINTEKRGFSQTALWAQKFHYKELPDEDALSHAIEYVRYNRVKHKLSPHYDIHEVIKGMISSYDETLFS